MSKDRAGFTSRSAQIAQAYRQAHEIVSAALTLALLAGGGAWLDRRYGIAPLLTVCGAVMGCAMAGLSLRQLLRRLDREASQKKRASPGQRGASED